MREGLFLIVIGIVIGGLLFAPMDKNPVSIEAKSQTAQTVTSPISISGNPDLSIFPGLGTKNHPYLIEHFYISGNQSSLIMNNTDAHVLIRHCYFKSSTHSAILLTNTINVIITDCTITNSSTGISLTAVSNIHIQENNISLCEQGIEALSSTNLTIDNNRIYHNSIGVSSKSSSNSTITNNAIFGNIQAGITLDIGTKGMKIFGNSIGWNGPQSSYNEWNAADSGDLNLWSENAWSDYSGRGEYIIRGLSESKDQSPSVLQDTIAPHVSSPEDIIITYGSEPPLVQWALADDYPESFTLVINSVIMPSKFWDNGMVSVIIPMEKIGTIVISIHVKDAAGNSANDSVNVIVTKRNLLTNPETVVLSSMISVVGVVFLLFIIKKTT